MVIEDKIFEYSCILSSIAEYDNNYSSKLEINDKIHIAANHEKIENEQWVYNIALINEGELIDSVYCDNNQEEIEDVIIFLIEEYVQL